LFSCIVDVMISPTKSGFNVKLALTKGIHAPA
jgi:hypothetical protein